MPSSEGAGTAPQSIVYSVLRSDLHLECERREANVYFLTALWFRQCQTSLRLHGYVGRREGVWYLAGLRVRKTVQGGARREQSYTVSRKYYATEAVA